MAVSPTASNFAGGKFTAIFTPDDPTLPCGEWKLITMYPNPSIAGQ